MSHVTNIMDIVILNMTLTAQKDHKHHGTHLLYLKYFNNIVVFNVLDMYRIAVVFNVLDVRIAVDIRLFSSSNKTKSSRQVSITIKGEGAPENDSTRLWPYCGGHKYQAETSTKEKTIKG